MSDEDLRKLERANAVDADGAFRLTVAQTRHDPEVAAIDEGVMMLLALLYRGSESRMVGYGMGLSTPVNLVLIAECADKVIRAKGPVVCKRASPDAPTVIVVRIDDAVVFGAGWGRSPSKVWPGFDSRDPEKLRAWAAAASGLGETAEESRVKTTVAATARWAERRLR